jgi:6-pyruvoyltetrahydropterin/6-carboxytetrahydropterin synthase
MVYLTRRERFNAAHKLWNAEWSEQENLDFYGGCANPNWHGHNYIMFVTIKGNINPETGFVVNLKDISKILKSKIISQIDHKNLNLDVPFMRGKITSTEVLAVAIWDQLYDDIQKLGVELHCIKINETENNSVEYYGE